MKFSPLARAAALGALVAAAGCTPVAPKADASAPAIAKTEAAVDDPYLWLEDISGAEALAGGVFCAAIAPMSFAS